MQEDKLTQSGTINYLDTRKIYDHAARLRQDLSDDLRQRTSFGSEDDAAMTMEHDCPARLPF
jgi:hypothetical protein